MYWLYVCETAWRVSNNLNKTGKANPFTIEDENEERCLNFPDRKEITKKIWIKYISQTN